MPFQRLFLFAALSCSFAFAGHAQAPGWKSIRYGQVSLSYPPTWQTERLSQDGQTAVTLTPDSMRNLAIRIIGVYELPLSGDHNYATFKKDFTTLLQSRPDWPTKVLKTQEISFKSHKTMYAEVIQSSLPAKVYGINAGTKIYMIVLLLSRHVDIPDPKMERDETAILNSITILPPNH
jgi:hypothetical protein